VEKHERIEADRAIKRVPARRWRDGAFHPFDDALAVEEPLEIRLGGRRFTVTMRTPGSDDELAAGFLLAEGFIDSAADISEIRRVSARRRGTPEDNVLDVILAVSAERLRERLKRNFVVSSSCGICGKTSIDSIERRVEPIDSAVRVGAAAVLRLPATMREAQAVFRATGGLHAAALFDVSASRNGDTEAVRLVSLREDIGRHNAVDKVVGRALMDRKLPLASSILMVSGRLSFEIVQKAAAAGVPILAAVSAPSSLAVELAERVGITAVGFLRERGFNVYTHPERIV
jgi:FdhD protein